MPVRLHREIRSFFGVGVIAAAAHYGALIALVETGAASPVPATLVGYVAGGIVSYLLNRRHTFQSERPHREATWRFVAVAAVGFLLTALLMRGLVVRWGLPYLPAQVVTTGAVLGWSFVAHRLWTFRGPPLP